MNLPIILYEDVKDYCRKLFFFKQIGVVSTLSYLDIAHETIADPFFSNDNYKTIAKRCAMVIITQHKRLKTIPYEAMELKEFSLKWPCMICENDFYKSNFTQSFAVCDRCYRSNNRDRLKENHKRWKEKNPERFKELNAKYTKNWVEKNKEKVRAYKLKWYQKNKEKQIEKARQKRLEKNENNNR